MIVTIDTIKVISVFVPKNPFTPISKSCYLLHNGLRTGELSLTLSSSHSIFWQRIENIYSSPQIILEWKSQELFQLVQNIFCSMKRKVFPLVIFCMAVNHSWLWLSTWKDNFCQSLSLLVFCFKYWTLSKDPKIFQLAK